MRVCNSDLDQVMEVMEVEAETNPSREEDEQQDVSQPKRRKVESSSETKDSETEAAGGEAKTAAAPQKEEPAQQTVEQTCDGKKIHKSSLSRQSSQESTRSSSPSSGCSTSTLTRQAHHKRTYENRLPAKRRRVDVTSDAGKEEEGAEEDEEGCSASRRRCSSSSSSDSDSSERGKEHRLTRSAKQRLQDQEKDTGANRQAKKPAHSSDMNASNNANTSTGGESGSDTSSVRLTRRSAGSQPSHDSKAQTNSVPSLPPETEVLGKRCSALNAAAKLLAMKGRVDTPGHTPRKDPVAKASGTSPAASSDKNQKTKSKSVPASPQNNSVNLTHSKSGSRSSAGQSGRPSSRSTRQCPGSLVPPLEAEYKRCRTEDRGRGSRRSSRGKEGEGEALSSSRGNSACSSISSDGGGRSSRSRSSSNSSQRTHSISSQNTEQRESCSHATSSGSERGRSSERRKRGRKEKQGRHWENRRSQRLSQEAASNSGAEGTQDRVLRSVAALAAVQARSPAASTRSSNQHRHNKT